ncbi:RNA 2'-phosphotransferase [Acuticoccus sp. M5D2P5]|uniref:RNA 2'-phosphotransferase n=1 Tax=Acuticoccus kalidii TaxID=2910977 RepID=UPI001F37B0DC|nr:RNA 2'-phosphotransferase [Acuticoccus kalidii]MCF3932674.1 RNA 2'-phosphotransferase [Acuticoccus kalidii]
MTKEISKFLSYVLRHAPETIGLKLDASGWADVAELLAKAKKAGKRLDLDTLRTVVAENDKQRFALSDDGRRIRAAQGHSVAVDLGHTASEPPPLLYHGTASRNLDAIFAEGLKPGRRQQVHLSLDPDTARRVGERHGKPTVLTVDAGRMHADGFQFVRADNGVWLTDHVPPGYLGF